MKNIKYLYYLKKVLILFSMILGSVEMWAQTCQSRSVFSLAETFEVPGSENDFMIYPAPYPSLFKRSNTGSAVININQSPTQYTLTGGGISCANTPVSFTLSGSEVGVNYQLSNGTPIGGSPLAGTGSALTWPAILVSGTFTVTATNTTTSQTQTMIGTPTATFNPVPNQYTLYNGGGARCSNGPGFNLSTNNSQTGVSYQLKINGADSGTPITGKGSSLSWPNQTTAGTYTVVATHGTGGCTQTLAGSAVITINQALAQYTLTGGGVSCANTPVFFTLSGSEVGVNYQLSNGTLIGGSPLAGTGSALTWPGVLVPGTFSVTATNPTTSCTQTMIGTPTASFNPVPTQYTLYNGGGARCSNGSGFNLSTNNSQTGVSYQLKINGADSGTPIAGTGSSLSWPNQTTAGTYTVVATHGTGGCTQTLAGSAVITIKQAPTQYTISGGGMACSGSNVSVTLSSSETGVNYQLKRNGSTNFGSVVAGTGNALSWALTTAGTYTILATTAATGCSQTMIGSTDVTIIPVPAQYTVLGGGTRCGNGSGITINTNGSQAGVNYQLKVDGVNSGVLLAGTGSALNWTNQTIAGTYTIEAIHATGGCTLLMSGNKTIIVNPAPTIADAGTDNIMCLLVANLSANTPVVGSGKWSKVSGPGSVTFANLSSPSTTATVSSAGTYVFRWTITTPASCTSTDDVQIIYNSLPTSSNAGIDQTACSLVATLASNTPLVGAGTWTQISGPSATSFANNASSTSQATVTASGTYVYHWTIANPPCVSSEDDVAVTYIITPPATFSYGTTPYCNWFSGLNALSNPKPSFTGGGIAGIFSSNSPNLKFVNIATGEVDLKNTPAGTYLITNSVSGAAGCPPSVATATLTIQAPTTFTITEQKALAQPGKVYFQIEEAALNSNNWRDHYTWMWYWIDDVEKGLVPVDQTIDEKEPWCTTINNFAGFLVEGEERFGTLIVDVTNNLTGCKTRKVFGIQGPEKDY